jgi:molybdate transport system ATP-binding protein
MKHAGHPALEVNATVRSGDFVLEACFTLTAGIGVCWGPSGAGKSVALALVAGFARPERGRVVLSGTVVADSEVGVHVPTQHRHVGLVTQQASLFPHRSVLDNVALAVRRQSAQPGRPVPGRPGRRQAAQAALDRVGAGHLADRRPAGLSGGEAQRVALARALAGTPGLLLLDEPFSALDGATRAALRTEVRAAVDDLGIAALVVTHDRADLEALADVVVPFEPGMARPAVGRERWDAGAEEG